MQRRLEITEDGSHTIFLSDINEHYHSIHGAVQESNFIFIDSGLKYLNKTSENINILEIGFGTGLNALLSYYEAQKANNIINYFSVEPYPLEKEYFSKLNYPEFVDDKNATQVFNKMHNCDWDKLIKISETFYLKKIKGFIQNINLNNILFDVVFFDAFSPKVQPQLWTDIVFEKIFLLMKKNGVFITYSTKGSVKRNLKKAGFIIENIPGPPGKREIIRAIKINL